MSSNNAFKSDLWNIHSFTQASMLVFPKEAIISALKDFFSKDSYYHHSKDQWGFNNTTDHTDLPPGADIPAGHPGSFNTFSNSLLSTRVFIGEKYRYDGIFYPAILVSHGGSKYVPISINREQGGIQYSSTIFEDGYGNSTLVKTPQSFITAGIWEGSINIEIRSRSLRARDDLAELVSMCLNEVYFDTLHEIGLIVKPTSISSTSEQDDRADKLFIQTITSDIRTEWRRNINISTLIDVISFTAEFVNLNNPEAVPSPNLTINTETTLLDTLLNM